jgi:hypothetical protein
MATYTYSLSGDFGGNINAGMLDEEITDNGSITENLSYVNVDEDDVSIIFDSALSSGEMTELNNVVSAHDPSDNPRIKIESTGSLGTETIITSAQTVNRTITLPDADTALVGNDTNDILSNKTVNTASNTLIIDASDVTTGTFDNSRVAESNVTQHEGAITHDNLLGVGTKSHAEIDSHVALVMSLFQPAFYSISKTTYILDLPSNITIKGTRFYAGTTITLTAQSTGTIIVTNYTIVDEETITVTLQLGTATDTFDLDITNAFGTVSGVASISSITVPAWTDLRSGGATLSTGELDTDNVEHDTGMTVVRDANGMYFTYTGSIWSFWSQFNIHTFNRGSQFTLDWVMLQPTSAIMIGIGSNDAGFNEASTQMYTQAEVLAYFQNATTVWGLYGNSGTPGTSQSQSNTITGISETAVRINMSEDGSGVITIKIYGLPSADQGDWDDDTNLKGTIVSNLGADAAQLMPMVIPINAGSHRLIAVRVY